MNCGGHHGKPELAVVDFLTLMEIMSPMGIELNGNTIIKIKSQGQNNKYTSDLLTFWAMAH